MYRQKLKSDLQKSGNLIRKLNTSFSDELKLLGGNYSKLANDISNSKLKCIQIGDQYKKELKESVRKSKEIEDKNSRIKQLEVEVSHLQDTVNSQREKIMSLTKDDSELSHYRQSLNSINSIELNNEM